MIPDDPDYAWPVDSFHRSLDRAREKTRPAVSADQPTPDVETVLAEHVDCGIVNPSTRAT